MALIKRVSVNLRSN